MVPSRIRILFSARFFLTLVFLFLFSVASTGTSHSRARIAPELSAMLATLDPETELSVIVKLKNLPDLRDFKTKKDKSERRVEIINKLKGSAAIKEVPLKRFLKGKGVKKVKSLWIINALAVTASAQVVGELAQKHNVAQIVLDSVVEAPVTEIVTEAVAPEWNIDAIGAPSLWTLGHKGAGVVVAGMDTGVDYNHTDLFFRWRGGTNSWFDPNGEHVTPSDASGHGTQTMGIMVGGDAGGSAIGVAPDATWIAVKIFNDAGQSNLSTIHQGFQWLLDPDNDPLTDDAPDVVNNSWTLQNINGCDNEFTADIQALKASSIMVLFSAGNYGPNPSTSVSPSNTLDGCAVGAVDNTLSIANLSSRGPSACDSSTYPEVVAPGISIRTADRTFGGVFPNSYVVATGTSYAAPHAAGGAALLKGAFPFLSVLEIEEALKQSAADLGANGPDDDYGYGLLDLPAAYNLLFASSQDGDGDGFAQFTDCNDLDPTIYPGAQDVKHDMIDQDCNGYDLTIDVIRTYYNAKRDALRVEATSSLGPAASLEVTGYGPMKWNPKKSKWRLAIKPAGGYPGTVTVTGLEGGETVAVPTGAISRR